MESAMAAYLTVLGTEELGAQVWKQRRCANSSSPVKTRLSMLPGLGYLLCSMKWCVFFPLFPFLYFNTWLQQSGLHAEPIDIDYKLHAILAGRKRRAIQTIQEESATNIYFPPLPLHPKPQSSSSSAHNGGGNGAYNGNGNGGGYNAGAVTPRSRNGSASPELGALNSNANSGTGDFSSHPGNSPPQHHDGNGGSSPLVYNPNIIWITGEFFNVGRARDALYHLAAHKVRVRILFIHKYDLFRL